MRFLITGGAGFVGSHLTESLVRDGRHEVVVLDNLYRGRIENLTSCGQGVRFVEGDIRDETCIRKAMQGVSVVFHLAAQANVLGALADPDYSFNTNVWGTLVVLKGARAEGVQRVIFSSSREVYGDAPNLPVTEDAPLLPKNQYGASKAAAEQYCRVFAREGLEVNVLRLSNVYGPREDRVIPIFLERALKGQPLVIYGGQQVLDFVWVDTVVDALIRSAFGHVLPGPVNVGSGIGTRLRDLAERVLTLTGSSSTIEVVAPRSAETVRFVADVALAKRMLRIEVPADPLHALAKIVPAYAAAATA
jgi:nucleoside-diphosphate-sugar epimerase